MESAEAAEKVTRDVLAKAEPAAHRRPSAVAYPEKGARGRPHVPRPGPGLRRPSELKGRPATAAARLAIRLSELRPHDR